MQQALSDFGSSLNRIRTLAQSILANTGTALANPNIRELHETQQCAAIVLLTGYFEAFLKDLVRRYIESISASGVAFASLPQAIQDCHFEGGGRVLTKASEAARNRRATSFGDVEREDIVARLYSASSAANSYQIVWEGFADTEANPGPDVVKKIAKKLNITNFWPTVSRKSGNPTRWSDTALTNKLNDLINQRNSCAHTGQVSPIPTAGDILDFADMLEAIGAGFVGALEDELAQY